MVKTVLFSPLGKTDPYRDGYEGPLLHILRHYRPEAIWLFYTSEIEEDEKKDNRFLKSIARHTTNSGGKIDDIRVEKYYSHIEDPSDFDAFENHYQRCFRKISELYPNTVIIVNISSGSPQMIASACLLAASNFSGLRYRCIQVKTPTGRSGTKTPFTNNYDDGIVDNLFDNLPDAENRCHEPNILQYFNTMRREQMKKLIECYDYTGALHLYEVYPDSYNAGLARWLKHMKARISFETEKATSFLYPDDLSCFDPYPVKNGLVKPIYEFFLGMEIKYLREEWADYIIKISPLLTELIRFYIQERQHYPLNLLLTDTSKGKRLFRSCIEKEDEELIRHLDSCFKRGFSDAAPMLSNLIPILQYVLNKNGNQKKEDETLQGFVKLREIEDDLRNPVAHVLTPCSDDWAKRRTGKTFKSIRGEIVKLMQKVMKNDFGKDWRDFPDRMNSHMLRQMESAQ